MDHRHSGITGGQLLMSHVVTVPPTIHLYISHLHPQLALRKCGNDADAAIELLMMYPNGLLSTVNDADNDNTGEEEKEGAKGEESRAVAVTVDAATPSSCSSSSTVAAPSISAPSSSIREAKHSSLSKKEIRQVSDPLLYCRLC